MNKNNRKQLRNRKRRIRRMAKMAIETTATIALIAIAITIAPNAQTPEPVQATEEMEPIPYYMTAEYREMKRQEELEAKRESEALRESIRKYNEAQQEEAERLYAEYQQSIKDQKYILEISEDDLQGFTLYQIPEDYEREGGIFPEGVQRYTYAECSKEGVDYAVIVAQIETETGYQCDKVGEAGDSGYLQIVPKWHEERMQEKNTTDLTDPYQNVEIGIDYMADLLEQYDGNYAKALTAYNCGPDGAYRYWFSAGVEANPYAKEVLAKAERIRTELEE